MKKPHSCGASSFRALVGVVERTRVGPRRSRETHGVERGFETGDKSHRDRIARDTNLFAPV